MSLSTWVLSPHCIYVGGLQTGYLECFINLIHIFYFTALTFRFGFPQIKEKTDKLFLYKIISFVQKRLIWSIIHNPGPYQFLKLWKNKFLKKKFLFFKNINKVKGERIFEILQWPSPAIMHSWFCLPSMIGFCNLGNSISCTEEIFLLSNFLGSHTSLFGHILLHIPYFL